MASKYNTFEWMMSGFSNQAEAEATLASNVKAFEESHEILDWTITTTVAQGTYGWKAQFKAVKGG